MSSKEFTLVQTCGACPEAWRNTESAPIARAVFTLVDTYDKSLWATVDEDNPIGKASFDLGLKDFQAIVGVPFDDSDGDWVATLVIRQEASPAKPEQTPREIKPGQRWRNKYGATEYTVVQGESMWCVTVDCVVMGCPGWRHESDLQAWLNENAEYVPEETA